MSTVVNNNSILKASKWIVLALFGFVFAAFKVVGLFFWHALFGQNSKQDKDDTPIGTRCWTTKDWRASGNYDEDGFRRW